MKESELLDAFWEDISKTSIVDKITRLEVISNQKGRQYVVWEIEINALSVQDEGRTVKLFIHHKEKKNVK
jgi:hypothetical protein